MMGGCGQQRVNLNPDGKDGTQNPVMAAGMPDRRLLNSGLAS